MCVTADHFSRAINAPQLQRFLNAGAVFTRILKTNLSSFTLPRKKVPGFDQSNHVGTVLSSDIARTSGEEAAEVVIPVFSQCQKFYAFPTPS